MGAVAMQATLAQADRKTQASLGVLVLTGLIVLVAFLLPDQVGTALTGRGVLVLALTFVVSGIVFISLLPDDQSGAGLGGEGT